MGSVLDVENNMVYSWAQEFVEETDPQGREVGTFLLITDVYECHIAFQTLSLLLYNGVVFAELTAHTSHVLKPLEFSIFGPLKENFRRRLNLRTITNAKEEHQDISTIC